MQRTLLCAALGAALFGLNGCALNDIFAQNESAAPAPVESAAPLPPKADELNQTPVLTEDDKAASISHAPQGSALELDPVDIRGSAAGQAQGQQTLNSVEPSDSEILLGSIGGDDGADALENSAAQGNVEILRAPEPERPAGVGAVLPDYASGSNAGGSCDFALHSAMVKTGVEQAAALVSRLKVEPGLVYVAPTIIPDAFLDCSTDLSAQLSQALREHSNFEAAAAADMQNVTQAISQNSGSASTLPLMIRTLRANNVPYLLVSSLRQLGSDGAALVLRFVRVSDGITLTQSFSKLDLNPADNHTLQ
ncbi:MAG: hypothetical protein IAB19_10595 [Proteobacteria bacterium]|uniref:FlgO domain-containing protein n=1 Tax=Candidatus Avisuccinivibrio stercorigallinarum TaxID=2840704 RepID=A0A9D9DEU6_9GAMM|nr:hypothetical protein [Candidatus Avisuccinivibrio stercorigallinarum]